MKDKRYHCVRCTVTAWLQKSVADTLGWTIVETFDLCPPCSIHIDRQVVREEEGAHAE